MSNKQDYLMYYRYREVIDNKNQTNITPDKVFVTPSLILKCLLNRLGIDLAGLVEDNIKNHNILSHDKRIIIKKTE